MENYPRETYGRSSINPRNSCSRNPYEESDRESLSEPFSPTGLLGERYDLLKQQMEARSRITNPNDSPFTRGLLGSLAESENRVYRPSYDSTRAAGGLSRSASPTSSSNQYRPRRIPSVSSVRTDSIYCAQSGVTPPPLLDISSTLPQRRASWRDRNSQGIRSPTVQPLLSLPETSSTQWNSSYTPALGRSHSVAVRSSSGSWGPSGSRSGSHVTPDPSALSRRVSTTTAPARPETWYQGDRAEPKRRGTLRSC
ncbi:hypothetical protein FOC1_g10009883 [Fusarium oxysporum f. sp. cubense race 1]|uniref:Uncharacterized protein n=1 Tax=Fusarium oxysporum f. sp. cubense (strain race 1) TaxID=1229664 RepID=N4UFA9_FUSC1|nr:hypothetical protein FOC1_g10009883 [Fusarium oxysporum f. sp. cubense race 1]